MDKTNKSSTAVDMTHGPIAKILIVFAIPILLGNLFQLLYNTVDLLVVGNFVGKEALAAVGSTTPIINILVMFFNGFAVGAGVIISRYYGAKDMERMHRSIETTIGFTFVCCVGMTALGIAATPLMLRMMSTPEDVMESASLYLRIYFGGISGLLIYNVGSGILRAVGDTKRPLIFLIFTSVLNIILDLLFVVVFHTGIAGAAWATIISQLISAVMILLLLTATRDVYRFVWKDLVLDKRILKQIFDIALPAGTQSAVVNFSNIILYSYINGFGSSCMAGWSSYAKIDQYLFLPMSSMGQGTTTFVSQNIGAKKIDRAKQGTRVSMQLTFAITFTLSVLIWIFAKSIGGMFSRDTEVIRYTTVFVRENILLLNLSVINQIIPGALRGAGDAKTPMVIMLSTFVGLRQLYLYIAHQIWYDPRVIAFGYPVGWITCSSLLMLYYYFGGWEKKAERIQENASC